jgi:hypothetical protein
MSDLSRAPDHSDDSDDPTHTDQPVVGAVVSIVRHIDGEAVVVRGRLVARQPSSITVQLDEDHQLPTGVALAVVVHGVVPVVGLGNFSAGNNSVATIRLAERRG